MKVTPQLAGEVRRLWRNGWTFREISHATGLGKNSISRILRPENLPADKLVTFRTVAAYRCDDCGQLVTRDPCVFCYPNKRGKK